MWPGDLPSTSVNCFAAGRPSVNFPCGQDTFHQLPSAFRGAGRSSVNFRQLSVQAKDLPLTSVDFLCNSGTFRQLLSTSHEARRTSVNFCNLSVWPRELPSTSINFLCVRRLPVNFRQLSMRQRDSLFVWSENHAATSISNLCGHRTLPQLPSTFRAAMRPSVNFC